MKHKPAQRPAPMHYSKMHELMASATEPMAADTRRHRMTRIAGALTEMMHAPEPSTDAWRVISDVVNLLETLVLHGDAPITDPATGTVVASHWRGCDGSPIEIADTTGLLTDAIAAMFQAGDRYRQGKPIRLDGPGLAAVRAVIEDFQAAIDTLPARTMVRCHRETERRTRIIYSRIKNQPDGVYVMAV